jgi:hypothetical protein
MKYGSGKKEMGRDAPSVDTIIYMSGQPSALIVDIVLLVRVLGGKVVNHGKRSKLSKILKIFIVVMLLLATIILTLNGVF